MILSCSLTSDVSFPTPTCKKWLPGMLLICVTCLYHLNVMPHSRWLNLTCCFVQCENFRHPAKVQRLAGCNEPEKSLKEREREKSGERKCVCSV